MSLSVGHLHNLSPPLNDSQKVLVELNLNWMPMIYPLKWKIGSPTDAAEVKKLLPSNESLQDPNRVNRYGDWSSESKTGSKIEDVNDGP